MKKYKIDEKKGNKTIESYTFSAKDIIDSKEKVFEKIEKAEKKVYKNKKTFGKLLPDIKLSINLIKDHFVNGYKIDKNSLLFLIAGIIYIVSPVDLIPDFIIGAGYLDDAAIFSMVLNKVGKEFVEYQKYNKNKG